MKYVTLYRRGRRGPIHTTTDAAIATHCRLLLVAFQCEVEISDTKPDGKLCFYCQREVARRGEVAER